MNPNIISCPHCNKEISIDKALSHQLQSSLKKEFEDVREKEREEERKQMREFKEKLAKEQEEKEKSNRQKVEEEIKKRLQEENEYSQKLLKEEVEENKLRNKKLMDQLTEMTRELRKAREDKENAQLEMEKKLSEESVKISEQAEKKVKDALQLDMAAKDKMLADAIKANEELKQKLTQGSQQMQGEIQELEIERMLAEKFPFDDIVEVKKGVNGADTLQIVRDQNGKECGSLLWESKRTKKWEPSWIPKLKDDKRNSKADIGIIVSNHLPKGVDMFGPTDGVFVTDFSVFIALAQIMRIKIIDLCHARLSVEGKNDKKEILWNYLTGNEFKQRMEVIVESFNTLKDGIEAEKRYFTKKWARDEKLLETVVNQTIGMHGDLQGLMGASLPEIKSLEMDNFEFVENTTIEITGDTATVVQTSITSGTIEESD